MQDVHNLCFPHYTGSTDTFSGAWIKVSGVFMLLTCESVKVLQNRKRRPEFLSCEANICLVEMECNHRAEQCLCWCVSLTVNLLLNKWRAKFGVPLVLPLRSVWDIADGEQSSLFSLQPEQEVTLEPLPVSNLIFISSLLLCRTRRSSVRRVFMCPFRHFLLRSSLRLSLTSQGAVSRDFSLFICSLLSAGCLRKSPLYLPQLWVSLKTYSGFLLWTF